MDNIDDDRGRRIVREWSGRGTCSRYFQDEDGRVWESTGFPYGVVPANSTFIKTATAVRQGNKVYPE